MATGGTSRELVNVVLKTATGHVTVKLSPELAAIVLDPNGDQQMKQSIKEAVLAQLNLNCEPREHHGNEGNQNQEKDSCSDVLNIPVSNNHDKIHIWKEDEERLLLNLRFDAEKSFSSMKSHEVLWGKITEKLNAENVNVSKVQVINKWKTLKKKYKEVIDDNSKTGNQRTNWKYFEVFNEAYGNKAGTQAALTFDSERDEKLKKGNPKKWGGIFKKEGCESSQVE